MSSTTAVAFLGTVALHSTVFGTTLLAFGFLRKSPFLSRFYSAKRYAVGTKRRKPNKLPNSPFSWMFPLFNYTEKDIAEIAGMDALAFLRLEKFGLELFSGVALLSLLVIIPTNVLGGSIATGGTAVLGDLDVLTMSNVPSGSSLLWVHLVVCLLLVVYTLRLVWRYNLKSVAARIAYLEAVEPGAESNTVLVQDIPGIQKGSILDTSVRLVQGPLRNVTPHSVSQALEEKVADSFGVGAGAKVYRSKKARTLAIKQGDIEDPPAPDEGGTSRAAEEGRGRAADVGPTERAASSALSIVPGLSALYDFGEESDEEDETYSRYTELPSLGNMERGLLAGPEAKEFLERHSVEELVHDYFFKIYGEDLACVNVIPSQQALLPMKHAYESAVQKLDDITNEYNTQLERDPAHLKVRQERVFGPMYGAWGKQYFGSKSVKMESVTFLLARLKHLKEELQQGQLKAETTAEPAAFVTFRSRVAHTIASSTIHDHDTSAWLVAPAPGPKEVIWTNTGMRAWLRASRSLMVDAAYLALMVFYGAIISAAQASLTYFLGLVSLGSLATSVLPGITLSIFLGILPTALQFLALLRGAPSKSRVQWWMVERYFYFLVVVVFVFQLLGQVFTDMWQLADTIVQNPTVIFELLAAYAPAQSWYFASYILVLGLSSRAIQLVNPYYLGMFCAKSLAATTARAKARVLQTTFFVYGAFIPYDNICVLLGLVFAVQNPILPLLVLVYFSTGALVARHNLLYVYTEEFQSGGAVWPTVVNQVMTGLLTMEIFMTGLFSLNLAQIPATLMFLSIPLTAAFWVLTAQAFHQPQKIMSLAAAASMDQSRGKLSVSAEELQKIYKPPVMKNVEEGYTAHVAEAEAVMERVRETPAFQAYKGLTELPAAVLAGADSHQSSSGGAGGFGMPQQPPTASGSGSSEL